MSARSDHRREGFSSSPMTKSSRTTPNSATLRIWSGLAEELQPEGADGDAGDEIADDRAQPDALEDRHGNHGRAEQRHRATSSLLLESMAIGRFSRGRATIPCRHDGGSRGSRGIMQASCRCGGNLRFTVHGTVTCSCDAFRRSLIGGKEPKMGIPLPVQMAIAAGVGALGALAVARILILAVSGRRDAARLRWAHRMPHQGQYQHQHWRAHLSRARPEVSTTRRSSARNTANAGSAAKPRRAPPAGEKRAADGTNGRQVAVPPTVSRSILSVGWPTPTGTP